jgi:cellobiose phosphorylase
MTKAKIAKFLKDAKKVEKMQAKMREMNEQIYQIQKDSSWVRYLSQEFHDTHKMNEEQQEEFTKAYSTIIHAEVR